jgi:RNA polymerase primary sigma factor
MFATTGHAPTDSELGEIMDIDEKMIDQLRSNVVDTLSIDEVTTTSNNQEINISDNLEDKATLDPQAQYYKERQSLKLEKAINNLESREAEIIRTYYGLNNKYQAKNFAQIADEMGLSRERVRQIQKEALKKILNDMQPEEERLVDTFIDEFDYL